MSTTAHELVVSASKRIRNLTPRDVQIQMAMQGARLIDVREPEELPEQGWVDGSVHVPRGLLEFWADPASPLHRPELDPARPTIVYCSAGSRSALAVETLQWLGYRDVSHLAGGIAAWKQAGLPVVGLESRPDVPAREQ